MPAACADCTTASVPLIHAAADNPHAASVVAAANAAAARRAEAKASRPSKPKGEGSRKRKGAPTVDRAAATADGASAPLVAAGLLPVAAPLQLQGVSASRRPAEAHRAAPRLRKHKQFGEDFVVTQGAEAVSPGGLDDGAADYADADYVPLLDEDDAGSPGGARRRRRTSTAPIAWLPAAAAPSGTPMPAAPAVVTTSCSGGQALPEITAIHVGDRNLLKIRVPGKRTAIAAQHPANCTQEQQQQHCSSSVVLLSRALVRDNRGEVQGAHCRFLLEPGANVPSICRKISAWCGGEVELCALPCVRSLWLPTSSPHCTLPLCVPPHRSLSHKEAQIEDFEAVPAEQVRCFWQFDWTPLGTTITSSNAMHAMTSQILLQVIKVHIRLVSDVVGRTNMLEAAILALIDALNGKDGTAEMAGEMRTCVGEGM